MGGPQQQQINPRAWRRNARQTETAGPETLLGREADKADNAAELAVMLYDLYRPIVNIASWVGRDPAHGHRCIYRCKATGRDAHPEQCIPCTATC
jgi:hypothetical protein